MQNDYTGPVTMPDKILICYENVVRYLYLYLPTVLA